MCGTGKAVKFVYFKKKIVTISHAVRNINIDPAAAGGPRGQKLIICPVQNRKQELAGKRQSGQQVRFQAPGRGLLLLYYILYISLVNNTEQAVFKFYYRVSIFAIKQSGRLKAAVRSF